MRHHHQDDQKADHAILKRLTAIESTLKRIEKLLTAPVSGGAVALKLTAGPVTEQS